MIWAIVPGWDDITATRLLMYTFGNGMGDEQCRSGAERAPKFTLSAHGELIECAKGSSVVQIRLVTNDRANEVRIFIPPDNCRGYFRSDPTKSTS